MFRHICLAVIYLNVGNYAWKPLYTGFKQKVQLKLSSSSDDNYNNSNEEYSNNSTNHTFMDDEEFMMILRFYRPI